MTSSDITGSSLTVFLLIISFIAGSFVSFGILRGFYEKRINTLVSKVKDIVEVKMQLRSNIVQLATREQENIRIIAINDKLFKETLVEIASRCEGELKSFVLLRLEDYIEKKKTLYVKK